MDRRHFLSASSLFLLTAALNEGLHATGKNRKLDAYLRSQMAEHQIPGLAIAVVRHGTPVLVRAFGLASIELNVPATVDSVFQLFSVSKVFAGLALAKLLDENKLTLDAPITDFLPNVPQDWRTIKISHLLNHTSGLKNHFENPNYAARSANQRATEQDLLQAIAQLPRNFPPSQGFSYTQAGYLLFGLIVKETTGMSYSEYVTRKILSTAGMKGTAFGGSSVVIKGRPPMAYNRTEGRLRHWDFPFSDFDYPGAGLNSSAADMARFFVALQAGQLVEPRSLELLWEPLVLPDGREVNYGHGWTVHEEGGRLLVGHEGGGCVWLGHFPVEQLSIAVLCNLNAARTDHLLNKSADFYLS